MSEALFIDVHEIDVEKDIKNYKKRKCRYNRFDCYETLANLFAFLFLIWLATFVLCYSVNKLLLFWIY
jgi:hypothetical protein